MIYYLFYCRLKIVSYWQQTREKIKIITMFIFKFSLLSIDNSNSFYSIKQNGYSVKIFSKTRFGLYPVRVQVDVDVLCTLGTEYHRRCEFSKFIIEYNIPEMKLKLAN